MANIVTDKALTQDEAKVALKEGKKIAHRYFMDGEWVKADPDDPEYLVDESGVKLWGWNFWAHRSTADWKIDWYEVVA